MSRGNNAATTVHSLLRSGDMECHGLRAGNKVRTVASRLGVDRVVAGVRARLHDKDLECGVGICQASSDNAAGNTTCVHMNVRKRQNR